MEEQCTPPNEFNRILTESIDETLQTMGDSTKQMIYSHLSQRFGVDKAQLPNRIGVFEANLNTIFGVGARHVEKHIIALVHAKTGVPSSPSYQATSLQNSIVYLKHQYESKH